ncbi:MAG: hypothetical protein KDC87_10370 [Planctomycetes bacterium]|nr:hypothetical protein [Planctomycetota bacterium]MCB9871159.1 hypothetical protein [Planctomycetota bacterium]
MPRLLRRSVPLMWWCVLVSSVVGQAPAAAAPPRPKATCAVLGGSVSAGLAWRRFESYSPDPDPVAFAERQLKRSIEEREYELRTDGLSVGKALSSLAGGSVEILDYAQIFYRNQDSVVGRQLRLAVEVRKCRLVVGLDLLVWFGFGDIERPRTKLSAAQQAEFAAARRLALQQRAFALLDKHLAASTATKTVFVIGDYPDLTKANPILLRPHQRPTAAVLAELNKRFHEFAAKRDRILVFPMNRLLSSAVRHQLELRVGDKSRKLRDEDTLQFDNIHPNKVGLAVLLGELRDLVAKSAPQVADCLPVIPPFQQLITRLGLKVGDLDYLATRAK